MLVLLGATWAGVLVIPFNGPSPPHVLKMDQEPDTRMQGLLMLWSDSRLFWGAPRWHEKAHTASTGWGISDSFQISDQLKKSDVVEVRKKWTVFFFFNSFYLGWKHKSESTTVTMLMLGTEPNKQTKNSQAFLESIMLGSLRPFLVTCWHWCRPKGRSNPTVTAQCSFSVCLHLTSVPRVVTTLVSIITAATAITLTVTMHRVLSLPGLFILSELKVWKN